MTSRSHTARYLRLGSRLLDGGQLYVGCLCLETEDPCVEEDIDVREIVLDIREGFVGITGGIYRSARVD